MRKIKYKKLSIQNFLSVGNDALVIEFQDGLNLITGKNIDNPERNNGSGKSSVIEAFFYAVFGKTIRDIKKEFIVNNVTKGKGNIELSFDVETPNSSKSYVIKRQVKPSKVELWCGDEDITKDSISNTDKYICDILGTNPVICRSCDILSLSDNIPFMGKTAAEKRKFIEDIFSLEIFGLMSKDLKDWIKENSKELSISTTKIEEISKSIETLTAQQQALLKQLSEREDVLNSRKIDLEQKLKNTEIMLNDFSISDNIDTLEQSKKKLDDLQLKIDSKISDINNDIGEKNGYVRMLKIQLNGLSDLNNVVSCEKCHQAIPETHHEYLKNFKNDILKNIEDIEEEIQSFQNKKNDLLNNKKTVQDKKSEILDRITQTKVDLQRIANLKAMISEYSDGLKQIELELQDKKESSDMFEDSIKKTCERKEEEVKTALELKRKSDDLEVCKFILGEEGIKSFVVKKLLKILNESIQKYITDLGMTMRCSFDEFFDEKLTNDRGKDISYWNLSGGERRTVDLACSWAFKDLKRKISGVSSNLEFCDEIFDGAFDERGLDLLIDVLKNRIESQKLSIYAISHRKEIVKHIEGEIVYLEKENGVTRRIKD